MTANRWEIAVPVPRKSLMSGPPARVEEPRKPSRFQVEPIQLDFSQVEARDERRRGFGNLVHYLEFDVSAEVEAQCRPLADEVRALTADGVMLRDPRGVSLFSEGGGAQIAEPLREVVAIAKSVHSLRHAVVKILVGVSPSVTPEGARDRVAAVVRDSAHAQAPEVSTEDLPTGGWVDSLVRHVAPLSADLAAVVASSASGVVSVWDRAISEALSTPYGRGLDQEVRALAGRFPELRSRRLRLMEGRDALLGQEQRQEQERVDRALRELRLS
ncbi:MAG: hypothetical protein ACRDUS_12930 [Mycobacterium sp.]